MGKKTIPEQRVIPLIGDKKDDEEDGNDGSKSVEEYEPQPMPCNHPNWSHINDPQDFDSACSYLCLCFDKDDAEKYVEKFQEKSAEEDIEHYKPKDLLRASKLPLLPPDNPDVAQHIEMIKKGQKMSPPMVIRGDGKRHAVIAAGYHRTCAAYYDNMNDPIPCVVTKR